MDNFEFSNPDPEEFPESLPASDLQDISDAETEFEEEIVSMSDFLSPAFYQAPDEFYIPADEVIFYEHHRLKVDAGQKMIRVDVYLSMFIKNISRSRVKNAADANYIKVNGKPVKASYKIKPGDEVSIILPYPPSPELQPENIPLDIVYEDEDLIIVNKPAGMACHPGCGIYRGTLINALLYHFNKQCELFNDQTTIRPGLVHRLDKDTTGLLVIAKNEVAYNFIAKQFFERTTERNYYAFVWGNIKQDKGTITGNIARSMTDRKRFMVYEDGSQGKHAVTHYEVLERYGVCTLVKCKLETGRTHQIRVHFKYLGNILFGDRFYGGTRLLRGKPSKAFQRFIAECLDIMPRQALHAKTLGFVHPTTREFMFFNSELPEDFKLLLRRFSEFMQKEDPTTYL